VPARRPRLTQLTGCNGYDAVVSCDPPCSVVESGARDMRIAFATVEYVTEDYFDGGIANYLHRVARALAELGHDVHVITRSETDERSFVHEGVNVHRIKARNAWQHLNRLTRYQLATSIYLLGFSVQVYRKLKQLSRRKPFDLAQFPNCPYCGLVSILFLRLPHVLRASSYQSGWNDLRIERKLDFKVVEYLEALQARLSPNIFAPSYTLRETLRKEAGLDRVRVIRTPIYLETRDWDYSVFESLLKGRKYLLYFGRFEMRKGFHVLCQAVKGFLAQNREAHVVLIGRDMKSAIAPSMAGYARLLLADYSDRVVIVDQLPHAQLYPIIEGAHLVVLPSLKDNLPNACLEAMALRKPVIGTVGASFEEMITDGETGFLVPLNDPEALGQKMIDAWSHPKLSDIGDAAREKAREFAPARTVDALLSYYREVLHGYPRAAALNDGS
jgi:glycosyltransferase involved in cell wall biosynthesis